MKTRIFTLALLTIGAAASQATVIDFEGHGMDFGNPMFEAGYTFTTATSGWTIATDDWGFSPPPVRNGTTRLLWSGNGNGGTDGGQVTMTQTNGNPFSLASFDASVMFDDGRTNRLIVIGQYSGGGTIENTFSIDTVFAGKTTTGDWTNLESVIFLSGTNADFITDPGVGLDNIGVDVVPEPASLAAMGLGLAAFLKRRRK